MTAAFVALPSLFFFPLSALPGQDAPGAETRLRDAIRRIAPERPDHTALALRKLARVWIEQNRNLAPAASLLNRAKALDLEHPETAELLQRIQQKSQGHISR